MTEHHAGLVIHTKRYRIRRLVHVEFHDRIVDAIAHEKRLKRWRRAWKINLIETNNPGWRDLTGDLAWLD